MDLSARISLYKQTESRSCTPTSERCLMCSGLAPAFTSSHGTLKNSTCMAHHHPPCGETSEGSSSGSSISNRDVLDEDYLVMGKQHAAKIKKGESLMSYQRYNLDMFQSHLMNNLAWSQLRHLRRRFPAGRKKARNLSRRACSPVSDAPLL